MQTIFLCQDINLHFSVNKSEEGTGLQGETGRRTHPTITGTTEERFSSFRFWTQTWRGLATVTPSQQQPDSDSRSSAGWRGSTWTPGNSAASAAAPPGASLLSDTLCGVGVHLPQPYGNREGGENCSRHFIRTELISMEDSYTQQCKKKPDRIIRDPNHSWY